MKTIQFCLLSTFLALSTTSFSQGSWDDSGTNIPVLENSKTPVIHYSDSLNQLFLLRQSDPAGTTYFDTLSRTTDEWGIYSTQISAVDFVATDDGKLTFIDVVANNFILSCYDAQLNLLWSSSPPVGSVNMSFLLQYSSIVKGTGDDYFVCYLNSVNNQIYASKYDGTSWADLGSITGTTTEIKELKVDNNGVPHALYLTYNTATSETTHVIRSFNGNQWDTVAIHTDPASFSSSDHSFAIDKNNDLYLLHLYTTNGTFGLSCHVERFSNGVNTTIDPAISLSLAEAEGNLHSIFDRNNKLHAFYTEFSLGWTSLVHLTKNDQTNMWTYQPPYVEPPTPNGLPGYQTTLSATVDELNCIHFAFDQDKDIFDPTVLDSVIVRKWCECTFLDSMNTISLNQMNVLSSSLTSYPYDYQWIDCTTNTPISGATSSMFAPEQNGSYAVVASSINSCADTSACVAVTTIGIDELAFAEFSIHPNPVSNELSISSKSGENTRVLISITDAAGKVLVEERVLVGNPISVEKLSAGHYFIQIEEGQAVVTIPFIKQ